VTDDDGATDTTTREVDVSAGNSPPNASFTFSPSNPTTGDRIDFDASGSSDDGSITSYEWDWTSDRAYETTGETAQHSYTDSGSYTVTLRVTDDDGATSTTTREIDVSSSSGTTVRYVGGSGEARVNSQRSGVRFTVENTGTQPAEIVGIEVSVAGGSARKINERNSGQNAPDQHEVYIQSSDNGILEMSGGEYFNENDRALQLDTRENLNDTAVVQPGDEATINTFEYRNNGGKVIDNMGGRELTVTLYFADGTSRQYTFTATDPY
jgi:PKD repeat protein